MNIGLECFAKTAADFSLTSRRTRAVARFEVGLVGIDRRAPKARHKKDTPPAILCQTKQNLVRSAEQSRFTEKTHTTGRLSPFSTGSSGKTASNRQTLAHAASSEAFLALNAASIPMTGQTTPIPTMMAEKTARCM